MSQTTMEESVGGIAMTPPMMGANGARANAGGGGGTIPPVNNQTASGQQDTPDFLEVYRRSTAATAMSSAGTKYVRELREHLEMKRGTLDIKIITLTYPPETLAIVCGDSAFLLIFSEANRKDDNLPTAALTKTAMRTLQSAVPNASVHNYIVVTPQDYEKVEAMCAHLINCFAAFFTPDVRNLNINSMNRSQIEISLNPHNYEDFTRRVEPHGVASRADIQMTVYLNTPKRQNSANLNMFEQIDCDKTELATIGSYVNFISSPDGTGVPKFLPEVHISSIVTNMPIQGMLPLLLSLATDYLIDQGGWKSQFSNLGGTHMANIGNLLMDPQTGAPWRCENITARDALITQYCRPPVLILDVVHGRAHIPGLEQYADSQQSPRIVDSYNRFLATNQIPSDAKVGYLLCQEYAGFVSLSGNSADSRWIDFLNMMVSHSTNRAQCELLMSHPNRPEDMTAIKRSLCSDLTLHYVIDMVILQPEVLRGVQAAVHQKLRTISGNVASGSVDMSALLAASQGFATGMGNTAYTGSITSPFAPIYNNVNVNLF